MDIKLAKAEAAIKKAKEAKETRSMEEILVEEAESSGDYDIVKEPGGQEALQERNRLGPEVSALDGD